MQSPAGNCSCPPTTAILSLIEYLAQFRHVAGAFYFASMLYLFLGIAIVADLFMTAVEKITNQRRHVRRFNGEKQQFEVLSVRVWNQTVANLTLMAFGSAAPEILLATIEIIKNKFESDELGPGTIVGASMFNTFVITAFCVICLPAGQSKQIRNIKVFWTTTFASLAAYIWLYLILSLVTPNEVTIVEALITLLLFPVMVICGYLAEKNLFMGSPAAHEEMDETRSDDAEGSEAVDDVHSGIRHQWREQISDAFRVSQEESASNWHFVAHFFTFFWKAVYAVVIPPVNILGGWLSLACSIISIAMLTALMGDLASSFGCALQWDMHTTSITVVAVGTSLPDLFASRVAAKNDNFADNAIGNINGSNAFNVFLGLGFPWLCAAIYHHLNGSQFRVGNLGDLAFSVQLFLLFSVLQLILMTTRRKLALFGGGELGGPKLYAHLTFWALIAIWLLYIGLTIAFPH